MVLCISIYIDFAFLLGFVDPYPILEFILITSRPIVVYISIPTSRPLVGLLVHPTPFKLNPLNTSWKFKPNYFLFSIIVTSSRLSCP